LIFKGSTRGGRDCTLVNLSNDPRCFTAPFNPGRPLPSWPVYHRPVDFLLLLPIALAALWIARARQQRRRIAILTRYLSGHDIEKNIETLSQGYSRALGESDPARSEQVWLALRGTEDALCRQVRKLAEDFAGVEPAATRVSKFPIWLPISPALDRSFDMREALRVHARGICRAIEEQDASPKDRAFAILAEMLRMRPTCHWFCRSKAGASAPSVEQLRARQRLRARR